jgi:aspartate aminotransferase
MTPAKSLSKRVLKLATELAFDYLAIAKEVAREGVEVISFGIGQPDFDTPDHIKEEAIKALKEGFTKYVAPPGIPELREAIAEYVSEFTGADVKPDEVIVLPGTKPGIYFSMMAYVEPGDEVIVPDPGFPVYESVVRYAGGKPVFVPLREENAFRMTPEAVQEAVTERTKMIILNSPNNPTGGMNSEADVKGVLEIAKRRGITVVSDEIYDHYVYEGEHTSVLVDPDWRDFVLYLNGFSKTYSMTGWRLGYLIARKEVIDRLEILAVNTYSCTSSFVQKAGVAALKGPQNFFKQVLEDYRRRRDFIHEELNKIPGVKAKKPAGAFYIFPNVKQILKQTGLSTKEFTIKILKETGVVTLPGSPAFPLKAGEGYLRVSYALPIRTTKRGLEKFREGIEKLTET